MHLTFMENFKFEMQGDSKKGQLVIRCESYAAYILYSHSLPLYADLKLNYNLL